MENLNALFFSILTRINDAYPPIYTLNIDLCRKSVLLNFLFVKKERKY